MSRRFPISVLAWDSSPIGFAVLRRTGVECAIEKVVHGGAKAYTSAGFFTTASQYLVSVSISWELAIIMLLVPKHC